MGLWDVFVQQKVVRKDERNLRDPSNWWLRKKDILPPQYGRAVLSPTGLPRGVCWQLNPGRILQGPESTQWPFVTVDSNCSSFSSVFFFFLTSSENQCCCLVRCLLHQNTNLCCTRGRSLQWSPSRDLPPWRDCALNSLNSETLGNTLLFVKIGVFEGTALAENAERVLPAISNSSYGSAPETTFYLVFLVFISHP